MKIWENIKAAFGKLGAWIQRFFEGRYGLDDLSKVMLWVGLGLYLVDLFARTGIFSLLGMVLFAVVLFRMLSRNMDKRATENRKYQARVQGIRTRFSQAKARFANRKEYKYVRCPGCRSWIRLPRGAGQLSVRCKSCSHAFEQKT